jgi:hypothetical protein
LGRKPLYLTSVVLEYSVEELFGEPSYIDSAFLQPVFIDEGNPHVPPDISVVKVFKGIFELSASPDRNPVLLMMPVKMHLSSIFLNDTSEHQETSLNRQKARHSVDYFFELFEIRAIFVGMLTI